MKLGCQNVGSWNNDSDMIETVSGSAGPGKVISGIRREMQRVDALCDYLETGDLSDLGMEDRRSREPVVKQHMERWRCWFCFL